MARICICKGSVAFLVAVLGLAGLVGPGRAAPVRGPQPQSVADRYVPEPPARVETWVTGLDAPWSLVFLPGGRALVSERPGRIRLIENGKLRAAPYTTLKSRGGGDGIEEFHVGLVARGEGGVMGLAVHPDFPKQPYIYLMHTYSDGGGDLKNRVIRLRDEGDHAEPDRVILADIPGGRNHDGGRIKFGPDGMLYITTGETFEADLAQDMGSLGGKILRVTPDGAIPADNPFPGSPIYTYGHRNPQGLAWHPDTGELFESEHGPSGEFGTYAHDEINVIQPGANFGWPKVIGAPGDPRYRDPIAVWPESSTPPSGVTFWHGDLFVATLRSEALLRIGVAKGANGWKVTRIARWFATAPHEGHYGRLRDAVAGPDGALYVLTNNRDGRGNPRAGDDRILRITMPRGHGLPDQP